MGGSKEPGTVPFFSSSKCFSSMCTVFIFGWSSIVKKLLKREPVTSSLTQIREFLLNLKLDFNK